jgi:hypothetical protein
MKRLCLPVITLCMSLTWSMARADAFVRDDINTRPQPSGFSVCHGYTCAEVSHISLTGVQWQVIRDIFHPPPGDPAEERRRIAQAIGQMEMMVGEITRTTNDKARTLQKVEGLYMDTQMDCIDESTNTTIYLMMMHKDNLLKWHSVVDRSTRGYFIFGMPHTTAVIHDTTAGELYAVDSWFEDNGKPPHIVPLAQWNDGWDPRR